MTRARLWPGNLQGQVLLALALALLFAQGVSTALIYRGDSLRRGDALLHTLALRLYVAGRDAVPPQPAGGEPVLLPERGSMAAAGSEFAPLAGDRHLPALERRLGEMLAAEQFAAPGLEVIERRVADDPLMHARFARRAALFARHPDDGGRRLLIAAVPRGGGWVVARVIEPPSEARRILGSLIAQTLMIYAVLVGAMALVLRRITRPLAALTDRLDRFTQTRDAGTPLSPQGPADLRRLIAAHNAMEARIGALLDEKDVMLGAIGHDLKTPLAALRVRIEAVEDAAERDKMARGIEDITRTLDDILSLARVGRPSDPLEPTELSALVAAVVEEFEDMGEPVTLADAPRLTLPLRATWLRRALRNLIGNALRYAGPARVSLAREGDAAVIAIDDDGPGIPPDDLARMLEPFTRGDPSRNSETGGAGLGLTLARAIAEQHGGTLVLANRAEGGLHAELRLPV